MTVFPQPTSAHIRSKHVYVGDLIIDTEADGKVNLSTYSGEEILINGTVPWEPGQIIDTPSELDFPTDSYIAGINGGGNIGKFAFLSGTDGPAVPSNITTGDSEITLESSFYTGQADPMGEVPWVVDSRTDGSMAAGIVKTSMLKSAGIPWQGGGFGIRLNFANEVVPGFGSKNTGGLSGTITVSDTDNNVIKSDNLVGIRLPRGNGLAHTCFAEQFESYTGAAGQTMRCKLVVDGVVEPSVYGFIQLAAIDLINVIAQMLILTDPSTASHAFTIAGAPPGETDASWLYLTLIAGPATPPAGAGWEFALNCNPTDNQTLVRALDGLSSVAPWDANLALTVDFSGASPQTNQSHGAAGLSYDGLNVKYTFRDPWDFTPVSTGATAVENWWPTFSTSVYTPPEISCTGTGPLTAFIGVAPPEWKFIHKAAAHPADPQVELNKTAIANLVATVAANNALIQTNYAHAQNNTDALVISNNNITNNTTGVALAITHASNNTAAIGVLIPDLAAAQTQIASHTTSIGTNTTAIAGHTTELASHTSQLATNTSGIATNTSGVATNAADMATGQAELATQFGLITANTAQTNTNYTHASNNTTAIAGHTATLATHTSELATHTSDIATHSTSIATNTAQTNTNYTHASNNTTAITGHTTQITGLTPDVYTFTTGSVDMTLLLPTSANLLFDKDSLWSKNGAAAAVIPGPAIGSPDWSNMFFIRLKMATGSSTFDGLAGLSQFLYPTVTGHPTDFELTNSQSWHFHSAPSTSGGDVVHPGLIFTSQPSNAWTMNLVMEDTPATSGGTATFDLELVRMPFS